MKEEIYEPFFEKEAPDAFKEDEVSMAIAGVLPPGVSPLKAHKLNLKALEMGLNAIK